ncbi:hypothetical protein K438DRAFT_1981186 [Mycena galopus ATCC 62051]|nr:hypothetical protein K438DRAFT_1981186 [Mycena galopus ATCC 62051]
MRSTPTYQCFKSILTLTLIPQLHLPRYPIATTGANGQELGFISPIISGAYSEYGTLQDSAIGALSMTFSASTTANTGLQLTIPSSGVLIDALHYSDLTLTDTGLLAEKIKTEPPADLRCGGRDGPPRRSSALRRGRAPFLSLVPGSSRVLVSLSRVYSGYPLPTHDLSAQPTSPTTFMSIYQEGGNSRTRNY